jgi:hypothetical protein
MPCPPPGPLQQYALVDGADVQVTSSAKNQSRSESVVAINPTNSQNMICASKKFIDPQKYHFTISTSFTLDGGQTWTESQPALQPGWDGMTDPDLTFDSFGHAYLIVEPLKFGADITGMGMYVLKSVNGGQSWGQPVQLHPDSSDDKQWITSDESGGIHHGALYAVWAANTPLRFSRSTDHGATWKGAGNTASGSQVWPETAFAPSVCVDDNGWVHIFWHVPNSSVIRYTRSKDGGDTFDPPISCVTGVSSLGSSLPNTNGWPHFPNATFRVLTLVTSCATKDALIVAWADMREGVSRIYYRMATGGGNTWQGPASGEALLPPTYGQPAQHHFHPQLADAGNEAIGCAFYEFGPKNNKHLIDVLATYSCSDGQFFSMPTVLTDKPWDPAVNAPLSHGDPKVTFIGEYFGFDASFNNFAAVWTDTRTGVQELFFDLGSVVLAKTHINIPEEVVTILAGIIGDGGGIIMVDHVIIHVDPGDPMVDVLNAIAAMDAVKRIRNPGARQALSSLHQIIANVAREGIREGRG